MAPPATSRVTSPFFPPGSGPALGTGIVRIMAPATLDGRVAGYVVRKGRPLQLCGRRRMRSVRAGIGSAAHCGLRQLVILLTRFHAYLPKDSSTLSPRNWTGCGPAHQPA